MTRSWDETYSAGARDVCRRTLLELAKADSRVICVDSDTGGLEETFAELPDQYVNVGIAEANLISMSAGLAAAGMLPFAHTISSFAATRACEIPCRARSPRIKSTSRPSPSPPQFS